MRTQCDRIATAMRPHTARIYSAQHVHKYKKINNLQATYDATRHVHDERNLARVTRCYNIFFNIPLYSEYIKKEKII